MVGSEALSATVKPFSAKVMDISQFLIDVLGIKELETMGDRTVTYHDPCHLKNSLGVTEQPRKLLKASKGVKYVEMNEAGVCCGNGGSFNLFHYDLSQEIGSKKADNVIASKAAVVATSCPACMMQLSDMLSQKNGDVAVKHVIEIYAETL